MPDNKKLQLRNSINFTDDELSVIDNILFNLDIEKILNERLSFSYDKWELIKNILSKFTNEEFSFHNLNKITDFEVLDKDTLYSTKKNEFGEDGNYREEKAFSIYGSHLSHSEPMDYGYDDGYY